MQSQSSASNHQYVPNPNLLPGDSFLKIRISPPVVVGHRVGGRCFVFHASFHNNMPSVRSGRRFWAAVADRSTKHLFLFEAGKFFKLSNSETSYTSLMARRHCPRDCLLRLLLLWRGRRSEVGRPAVVCEDRDHQDAVDVNMFHRDLRL